MDHDFHVDRECDSLLCRSSARELASQEVPNRTCDFRGMGFECKVASIVETDFCLGVIPPEHRRAERQEERITFAPDREQRGSLGAEIFLEVWIKFDITGV